MLKEIIETGKTVDDAIENACLKLGCQREDCQWEILDLPKKTFFGLKSNPAKVKVAIEVPDPKPEKKPVEKPKADRPREQAAPRPQQQKPPRREEPKPKPAPEAAAQEPVKKSGPRPERRPEKEYTAEEIASKSKLAEEYITGILSAMGLEAEVGATFEDGGILVSIQGKGLGVMIGRRGETLDAVQYLTGLVINRMEGSYMRVTIDCGDYRVKRQKTLEALAKKLAAQVLKTNISKTLEPMNPFERRIIHSTVSEIEGVSSTSIGEEPNRRVVISTPTSKKPAGRGGDFKGSRRSGSDRGERRGGGRRDFGDRGDRRGGSRPPRPPKQAAPEVPKATPEAEVDATPLYTKIDLD